ncbi:hypothetical protein WR25_09788 [Diploscapter pachys]|uniref:SLC41A/MgtE integral membrane domain-containing protein n=1 Tax=Diploscapter pachys TaxID=2018661 RepID=A0A2A2KGG2_9BILA|nr:hypothetical protein WR25_09788 [Diploscapter pachys]
MPSDGDHDKSLDVEKNEGKEQEAVRQGIAELTQLSNALNQKSSNVSSDSQPLSESTSLKFGNSTSASPFELSDMSDSGKGRCVGEGNVDGSVPESSYVLFFQVVFPFAIAGIGMVFAGIVLDRVQHWRLFIEVPETFILVPALLGLKGNLEMTLASRLSTFANMGHLDSAQQRKEVIAANLALIQVQATVVAFLASAFAIALAWIPRGQLDWSHATLLCASSLATACTASLFLSLLMSLVVYLSRKYNINPDNVATPIAASLGDLTTLGILSLFGTMFLDAHLTESYLNLAVIFGFLLVVPVWAKLAAGKECTADALSSGWTPVIFSMLLSSGGGFILENAIRRYSSIAVFQPVINGVGGNLAAVQASRMSTALHKETNDQMGILPNDRTVSYYTSLRRAFFSSEPDSRSARVLIFLVVPGHIFFNWLIRVLHFGNVVPPSGPLFTSLYLIAAVLQVVIILFVCQYIVSLMWQWHIDPDNAAIPYLTALGDLLGTLLLFIVFLVLDRYDTKDIVSIKH